MDLPSYLALAAVMAAPAASATGIAGSVAINGFDYSPPTLQVEPGQTIDFAATGFHPLKLDDDDSVTCTQDCNVTFLGFGHYGFYCGNHGSPGGNGMSGVIGVVGDPDSAPVFAGSFEHTLITPRVPG